MRDFSLSRQAHLFGIFLYKQSKQLFTMKKTKTFNQEVEHFGHVLEAEILKKEC